MNVTKYLGFAAMVLSLGSGVAFAHHHELGTSAALFESAEELQQAVSYSPLSYQVKYAVYDFDMSAGQFDHCVSTHPAPGPVPPPGPIGSNHHHEVAPQCQELFMQVRDKFSRVDYYLDQLDYYQSVSQAYHEAREALDALAD